MWKPTNQPEAAKSVKAVVPSTYYEAGHPAMPPTKKSDESHAATGSKRINVIFSASQYQLLKNLAERQSISVSDVLRQALSLAKLVVEANENPDERILIEKRGQLQELRLVR